MHLNSHYLRQPPSGMKGFSIVWLGQLLSLMGTGMTRFALIYWAFGKTGQATTISLLVVFIMIPQSVALPLAGVLVDRWSRKAVMIISDFVAGIASIVILIVYLQGSLQIWHLYLLGGMAGFAEGFQLPSYSAAITMMLPKHHYTRANAMLSTAKAGAQVMAPLAAAALMGVIGISGILIVDLATFIFAEIALLIVNIPNPYLKKEDKPAGNIFKQSTYGFSYIYRQPYLVGLTLTVLGVNLFYNPATLLIPALILARTGNNEIVLGSIQAVAGIGGLAGGILLSTWGGPRRKTTGLAGGIIGGSILGIFLMGLAKTPFYWSLAGFFIAFFLPIFNGCNQAIWQAKIPPAFQGRVFSARILITGVSSLLGLLISGPLIDWVLEPAMNSSSTFSLLLSPLVGSGTGSGISVMYLMLGIGGIAAATLFLTSRCTRRAEDLLPDYDRETA